MPIDCSCGCCACNVFVPENPKPPFSISPFRVQTPAALSLSLGRRDEALPHPPPPPLPPPPPASAAVSYPHQQGQPPFPPVPSPPLRRRLAPSLRATAFPTSVCRATASPSSIRRRRPKRRVEAEVGVLLQGG